MKKTPIIILLLLSILLIGAKDKERTYRLTVINKSDMPIGIRLYGTENSDHLFYLTVQEGSRSVPQTGEFDIPTDIYRMQLYYIQTYDPVYGWECTQPVPNMLGMLRNIRVVVLPCHEIPRTVGEPSMRKYLPYPVINPFRLHRYWIYRYIY